MRKTALVLSILMSLTAFAQKVDLDALRAMVEKGRVSAEYSFMMQGKIHCSGTITIQQPCFKAVGNGLEIYCDGVSRWTVDREIKEVYIEPAERPDEYIRYLSDVTDLDIKSVRTEAPGDDTGIFTFDTETLDSSWVVTDLR